MRIVRFALIAAAIVGVSISASDAAFARGNGASGGGSSGGSAGGAGAGSNPNLAAPAQTNGRGDPRRFVKAQTPRLSGASCYKQQPLFDRYGFAVVDLHSVDCFE
jgi:hypothetical protein